VSIYVYVHLSLQYAYLCCLDSQADKHIWYAGVYTALRDFKCTITDFG